MKKKRLALFALILVAVTCNLFATNYYYYYLFSNDYSICEGLNNSYGYEDGSFKKNWKAEKEIVVEKVYGDNPELNKGVFNINCGAQTEFGFYARERYEYNYSYDYIDYDDYIVEYDPKAVTLVTKASKLELISESRIRATISYNREVIFKANPVLSTTYTSIRIVEDSNSTYYPIIDARVTINPVSASKELWYIYSNDVELVDYSYYYDLFDHGRFLRNVIDSSMKITALPLSEFYLYPSESINTIGYTGNKDLYVVKYDSKYFTCSVVDNVKTKTYKDAYGIQENSTETIVVVDASKAIKFTRNNIIPDSPATTSIEIVPYPFFMDTDRSLKISVDLGGMTNVEMAKDKTTRIYAPNPYYYVTSKSNFDVKTRGLTVGENEIKISWKNFNTVRHSYRYYLETLNYKGYISECSEYIDSNNNDPGRSEYFTLNLSRGAFKCEDYLNGEEVKIRLHVLDDTDRVHYYYDFTYPLEDLEPNFWSITNFAVATNGDEKLGALVDTEVWFDFNMKATTPQDQFDCGYIVIYDSTRTKVFSTSFSLRRETGVTEGAFTSGWGKNKLFSRGYSSFTPKSTGKYYVDIYCWNDYGYYNVGKYSTTFTISK